MCGRLRLAASDALDAVLMSGLGSRSRDYPRALIVLNCLSVCNLFMRSCYKQFANLRLHIYIVLVTWRHWTNCDPSLKDECHDRH